jgi:uncharacterized protein YggE
MRCRNAVLCRKELDMGRIAVILALAAMSLWSMETHAQAQSQRPSNLSILTAEGSGQAQAKPDFAHITAAVSAKAQNLDSAVQAEQDSVARANTLLQSLAGDGVEVERSNFSLAADRPPYPKPDAPQPPPSFTATTTFALKATRLGALNGVVSRLASSGLFELQAVSFEVADMRQPLDEARRNAVADARHKAQVLADAAGVRLDDILTVSDANAAPRVFGAAEMRATSSLLVIPPATLSFAASVSISWRISPKP